MNPGGRQRPCEILNVDVATLRGRALNIDTIEDAFSSMLDEKMFELLLTKNKRKD